VEHGTAAHADGTAAFEAGLRDGRTATPRYDAGRTAALSSPPGDEAGDDDRP
jgi:hypothetical protein